MIINNNLGLDKYIVSKEEVSCPSVTRSGIYLAGGTWVVTKYSDGTLEMYTKSSFLTQGFDTSDYTQTGSVYYTPACEIRIPDFVSYIAQAQLTANSATCINLIVADRTISVESTGECSFMIRGHRSTKATGGIYCYIVVYGTYSK